MGSPFQRKSPIARSACGWAVALAVLAPVLAPAVLGADDTTDWLDSLVRAFDEAPGTFVERLPRRSGELRNRSGSCDWKAGSWSKPELECALGVRRLDGLVRLDLVGVSLTSPTHGGPGRVSVAARLEVAEGTARVYLEIDTDLGRLAAALGGGRPPDPPVVRRGYRYAEARPGEPAEAHGDVAVFGSELAVWVEAVGGPASGLELRIAPR